MLNKIKNSLILAGVSAGLMYLFDPDHGNRRRALLRDKITDAINKVRSTVDVTRRDLENRAYGMLHQGRLTASRAEESDEQCQVPAGANTPQGDFWRTANPASQTQPHQLPADELIDEALMESFPASDPPSFTQR
jgi:hypothetical protein